MRNILTKILLCLEILIGLSAVGGGLAIMFTDWMKLPSSWLANSPFHSYFFPGLILTCIVGGNYLLAALLTWKKNTYSYQSTGIAAFGLLIWIYTEIYIINQSSFLQTIFFASGIGTLVLLLILLIYFPEIKIEDL